MARNLKMFQMEISPRPIPNILTCWMEEGLDGIILDLPSEGQIVGVVLLVVEILGVVVVVVSKMYRSGTNWYIIIMTMNIITVVVLVGEETTLALLDLVGIIKISTTPHRRNHHPAMSSNLAKKVFKI